MPTNGPEARNSDHVREISNSPAMPAGEKFLLELSAHPQLAVRNLMNSARRAALGSPDELDEQIEPGFGAEFDEAMTAAMRRLGGELSGSRAAQRRTQRPRLTGPITYNKTSATTNVDINAAPTKSDLAWLLAAERMTHDVLSVGVPDHLAGQAHLFAVLTEPVKTAYARHGLDRRGTVTFEAAARYLVHHAQPAHLRFVTAGQLRRWRADQLDLRDTHPAADSGHADHQVHAGADAGDPATAAGTGARLFARNRVLWAHPDGIGHGLLIDRFHHTHRAGLTARDSWTLRKVAEDLTSINDFLATYASAPTTSSAPAGAGVLGVRVLTHRAPNNGLHFVPELRNGRAYVATHHRIGDCDICATRTCLPNAIADQAPTDEVQA